MVIVDEAEERDEPAIWRLGVDPRGMSFTGSLQNATHRHQIGGGRPMENVHRLVLAEDTSQLPSDYRQAFRQIIVKGLRRYQ
jgi:hypothetical protein